MKRLLLVSLALALGTLVAAQDAPPPDQRSPTTTVNLVYVEGADALSLAGGSIVGVLNDVSKIMDATGTVHEKAAVLQVELQPRLSEQEGALPLVGVDVKVLEQQVGRSLENRRAVRSEMSQVLRKLRNWSLQLDAAQHKELTEKGRLELPLDSPFAGLQYLEHNPVRITVVAPREKKLEIRCLEQPLGISPIEYVRWERSFVVEVRFKQPPPADARPQVALTGDGSTRQLPLAHAGNAWVFWTDPVKVDAPTSQVQGVLKAAHGTKLTATIEGEQAGITVVGKYRIGKLAISYIPREVEIGACRNAVREAEEAIEQARKVHAEQSRALRQAGETMAQLSQAEALKRAELAGAQREVANFRPDEGKKTDEYRKIEARIGQIRKRMTTIEERVKQIKEVSPNAPPEVTLGLLDEHRDLKKELGEKEARLAELNRTLGISGDLAKCEARVRQLDNEHFEAKRKLTHATTDFELQAKQVEHAVASMKEAEAKHAGAVAALEGLTGAGKPLITKITTRDYTAELWRPGQQIDELNKSVELLAGQLREIESVRGRCRAELRSAVEGANAVADHLVRAAYLSALGQAGIEAADFLRDAGEAWSKGGPYAAGIAVIRKAVEVTVFPPSYYDPAYSTEVPVRLVEASWDNAGSKTGKRLAKTVSGHSAKVWTAHYLKQKSEKALDEMWKAFMRDSWFDDRMREIDPNFFRRMSQAIGKMIGDERRTVEEAQKRWKDFVGKNGFGPLAKEVGKSFAKGLVKDVAKEALKREVAEFFEGEAWVTYVAAQAEVRYASRMLLRTSNVYWRTMDAYTAIKRIRDALVTQYDPANEMYVSANRWFMPEPGYEIRISDNGSDPYRPSVREMDVTLGGVKLSRSHDTLVFVLREEDVPRLQSDAEGGLALAIAVRK